MPEPLAPSSQSFAQDEFSWVAAGPGTPGVRNPSVLRVVSVRHLKDSTSAREAFVAAALPWPGETNDLHLIDHAMLARRHVEEVIIVSPDQPALQQVCAALRGGSARDAIAIDVSDAMRVVELHGPALDDWLAHLVDASSIPALGRATRCRLADIAVFLMRVSPDRVLMIFDRALSPYLAQWLTFSHEGAFSYP